MEQMESNLGSLLIFFVYGLICFWIGKYAMLRQLTEAAMKDGEENSDSNDRNILVLEKHHDVYYAYVGRTFVGQDSDFNKLVEKIHSNKQIKSFVWDKKASDTLNDQERADFMSALVKAYGDSKQ